MWRKLLSFLLFHSSLRFVRSVTNKSSSTDFDESRILGNWKQVYSNRYVQETQEVNWKCVSVNLRKSNGRPGKIMVRKTGYTSNNRSNPSCNHFTFNRKNPLKNHSSNNVMIEYITDGHDVYTLRDYGHDYNYLLWTKYDNSSLYVWAKNVIEFKVNDDWKVLERCVDLNYTGYYLFPLSSYTFNCMDDRNYTLR
jgi:hypothetical protein